MRPIIIFRKRKEVKFPQEFEELAVYNSEVHRGIIHTKEWVERMRKLSTEFTLWNMKRGYDEKRRNK